MKTRAIAYSQFWRIVAAALVAVSRGSLLGMLVAMFFFETRLDNQLRLLRTFVIASFAPGLAAWFLARAFAATVTIRDGILVVHRRDRRTEVPCDSISEVRPWHVPLPAGGVWLRLRSGRWFPDGLQIPDPIALIAAAADAGAPESTRAATREAAAVYMSSRRDAASHWYHPLLKFVVLGLGPAVPLFRLHQWIAYGDTFGEYYSYGLQAYLLGFAAYWWTFVIYLVLYAAFLRTLAELAVIATAYVAPARVMAVRPIVERLYRIAYFGGVPVYLLRVALLAR